MRCAAAAGLILALLLAQAAGQDTSAPPQGPFRAELECPGGAIPFGLEFGADAGVLQAWVLNGPERLAVPKARWDEETATLRLDFPHYDSWIEAGWVLVEGARHLRGTWIKTRSATVRTELKFRARPGKHARFDLAVSGKSEQAELATRWKVRFQSSEDPAVGILRANTMGEVHGTFLTTTGDYRFLAGNWNGKDLALSCFDGAHAFLFRAQLQSDGRLEGGFWSRDTWHETWVASADPNARLPDAMRQVRWLEGKTLGDIKALDASGEEVALDAAQFRAPVRIVEVFGSWCPNCHEHARFMQELHARYQDKGLGVVGIAFELTGNKARDRRQVDLFGEQHGLEFPLLLGGTADKAAATRTLGVIDRLRSYPTTLFFDRAGRCRAIWSGYSGPATEGDHAALRRRFSATIERLLGEG